MPSNNDLVLVIPPILEVAGGAVRIDRDFANNLTAYLAHFDRVDVYCPKAGALGSFPAVVEQHEIPGHERLGLHILPQPYREDRYLRHRLAVGRQLKAALARARYRLISPHAPLSWSSLAGRICVRNGWPFDFEADWDLAGTSRYIIAQMPPGPRKLHHRLRFELHMLRYRRLLRRSSLALVQGQDVYEAYKGIAPNIHSVLNIQITAAERIAPAEVEAKAGEITAGAPLKLVYAGRASEMKGPLFWLDTMRRLREAGVRSEAVWLGGGEELETMRAFAAEHGLAGTCALPGNVAKEEVLAAMKGAHLFVFCHMGYESPRNLMEAVASGAPLCGFATPYSRSLVAPHGGGAFVERGDTAALAETIASLDRDRPALAQLVRACARSGQELDRDKAIEKRITLLKEYL
ncbi:glycosyltransferase [Qipengyuania sediminis]|uniref:glycosyltransferase n=1 Tax=Qipengyuania sediminis TaxID=1532023 RepID=UPI0010596E3C|nr:glycosyltransferase [Qipengyuania sediminis]